MPILIDVDANSGVPVFRQLVDQIRFHIVSGLMCAGEELPSTRQLSQELGINPMTISKAFALLEEEGLVERRAGLPSVVRRLNVRAAERERLKLLREALEPAALIARQLGVSAEEAAEIYTQMMRRAEHGEGEGQ